MSSLTRVFFVVCAFFFFAHGCAPSDGSIPTLSKEFEMDFLPPTAWTYNEPSEFGQAMTKERANRRFQNDIRGAIFSSVDKLAPGISAFKIDSISDLDVQINLDQSAPAAELAELTRENTTVIRRGSDYFSQKATAKLSATIPLAKNQWEAIANGVTLKLINEYDVSFIGDENGIFVKN
ncbi:hypothetical protein L596_024317 [Steinernema carpocapsae]|uniref:Uncharacterized protein n=1 Tax=Steinernema carpocapsae TaxID=34508 RepID=A0A4U5MGE5_STECR|nr:hypothetical protein L596_024317 [Steinernema carpocapsae]